MPFTIQLSTRHGSLHAEPVALDVDGKKVPPGRPRRATSCPPDSRNALGEVGQCVFTLAKSEVVMPSWQIGLIEEVVMPSQQVGLIEVLSMSAASLPDSEPESHELGSYDSQALNCDFQLDDFDLTDNSHHYNDMYGMTSLEDVSLPSQQVGVIEERHHFGNAAFTDEKTALSEEVAFEDGWEGDFRLPVNHRAVGYDLRYAQEHQLGQRYVDESRFTDSRYATRAPVGEPAPSVTLPQGGCRLPVNHRAVGYDLRYAQEHHLGQRYVDESRFTDSRHATRAPVGEPAPSVTLPQANPPTTTLVLKNVAARCSVVDLLETVRGSGFQGEFLYLYLPMNRNGRQNKGYAFACFQSETMAQVFFNSMSDAYINGRESSKRIQVEVSLNSISFEELFQCHQCLTAVQSPYGPVLSGPRTF
jgi:hypothetical protein